MSRFIDYGAVEEDENGQAVDSEGEEYDDIETEEDRKFINDNPERRSKRKKVVLNDSEYECDEDDYELVRESKVENRKRNAKKNLLLDSESEDDFVVEDDFQSESGSVLNDLLDLIDDRRATKTDRRDSKIRTVPSESLCKVKAFKPYTKDVYAPKTAAGWGFLKQQEKKAKPADRPSHGIFQTREGTVLVGRDGARTRMEGGSAPILKK